MKSALASLIIMTLLALGINSAQAQPLEIVATFSILGDLVQQIGGEQVHVTTLVGADGDAHAYKPTPNNAKAIAQADLVIENGLGMESWIERLIAAAGFKGRIVIASQGVTPRQNNDQAASNHTTDPHAWQNIANTRLYVRNIAEALSQTSPASAAIFKTRATAYDEKLKTLDEWVKSELASIPPPQRKIITSHDAFGYFGAAYDITFLAPQGVSTEIEPTATQVAKLINQMKKEKVKRVFFESMASPKLVSQLAKDAGATVGSPIYSDALSNANGPAATYLDMVHQNVLEFKRAMLLNGS